MGDKAEEHFARLLNTVRARKGGYIMDGSIIVHCPVCMARMDFVEVVEDGKGGDDRKVAFACNSRPAICNVIVYVVEPYRGDPT